MITDAQRALAAKIQAGMLALLESAEIPVKALKVMGAGSVLATFYCEQSAKNAAQILGPILSEIRIGPGLDDGKTTEIRNALRRPVPVWRMAAMISDGTPTRI